MEILLPWSYATRVKMSGPFFYADNATSFSVALAGPTSRALVFLPTVVVILEIIFFYYVHVYVRTYVRTMVHVCTYRGTPYSVNTLFWTVWCVGERKPSEKTSDELPYPGR